MLLNEHNSASWQINRPKNWNIFQSQNNLDYNAGYLLSGLANASKLNLDVPLENILIKMRFISISKKI
jgi:hypothetical protein